MQNKPIKFGVIGCGIAANERHWPALQQLGDMFQIAAVCNNTQQKAVEFAETVGGVPYVLDHHELLAMSEIEAVDIAVPIHLNYEITRDALAAGKHVLVEKPMAANLHDAEQMLAFEQGYPQVKMVAENFYYHAVYVRLKELLDAGEIGKPYALFWDLFRVLDSDNKYAQTDWRIDHQYPGGFITDGGIHNIAALRLMFGDIVAGSAFTKSVNPEIGEMDSFSFQFETKGGVHGVLNIFLTSRGFSRNHILILGDKGSFRVEDNRKIVVTPLDGEEREEVFDKDISYVEEFKDFYAAIRQGRDVRSSFARGYRDLQILLRAIESAGRSHTKI